MAVAQRVLATLKKHNMVSAGDKVLIAASGGPDSMALLHILLQLQDELGIELHVFHLNHCFRGKESAEDSRLVQDTACFWGIPCSIEEYDVPEYCSRMNKSSQEGAREVRYNLISRVAAQVGAARVALGHHADDQAETIIINLLRGSGLTGLKGFLPVRDNFYIRPLFNLRRKEIEDYCQRHGIQFRIDSSNLKTLYKRNRIRLELMPLLEEYNPALVTTLVRTGNVLRDEDEFLEEEACKIYSSTVTSKEDRNFIVNINTLLTHPTALQRRVLRKLWHTVAEDPGGLGFEHLESILDLIREGKGSWVSHLPKGVRVTRNYGFLYIKRECEPGEGIPPYSYSLKVPGAVFIPETGVTVRAHLVSRSQAGDPDKLPAEEVFLDIGKLESELIVRRRLPGDRFAPLGMGCSTIKLKKFFIDQKIPREERDRIPLVVYNGEIAWVAGIRPGEKFKVGEDSETLLHLSVDSSNFPI